MAFGLKQSEEVTDVEVGITERIEEIKETESELPKTRRDQNIQRAQIDQLNSMQHSPGRFDLMFNQ